MNTNDWDFVFSYTRAQAIADGVLVDVGASAREAGFRLPMSLTQAAWADCVAWSADETTTQDESGRLWDVLYMASLAARSARNRNSRQVPFAVVRVPRGGHRACRRELVLHIGPGDDGEPVLTILLPGED